MCITRLYPAAIACLALFTPTSLVAGEAGNYTKLIDVIKRTSVEVQADKTNQLTLSENCRLTYTSQTNDGNGQVIQEEGFEVPVAQIDPETVAFKNGIAVLRAKEGQESFEYFHKIFEFPPLLGEIDQQMSAIEAIGGICSESSCSMPRRLKSGGILHFLQADTEQLEQTLLQLLPICAEG